MTIEHVNETPLPDPKPLYYPSPMVGEWGGEPGAPPLPIWRWILGFVGIEPPYRRRKNTRST